MRKIILPALLLTSFGITAFAADRHIAFERNNAVYIANLDGTGEKKIADGIFFRRSRLMELASRLILSKKRATRVTCVTSAAVQLPPES
jgi:hypothetical protein